MQFIKMRYFFILILFISSNLSVAVAGNNHNENCDPLVIKRALEALRFSSTSTTNGNFIAEVLNFYDSDVYHDLIEKNKFLMKNPNQKIDLNTIKWFLDSYLKMPPFSIKQYFIVPFTSEESEYGIEMMMTTLIGYSFPLLTIEPVLLSPLQLEGTKKKYKENNDRIPINLLIEFYEVSYNTALKMAQAFYIKIFEQNNYILTSSLRNLKSKKLYISAHGAPGYDGIFVKNTTSDKVVTISSMELVQDLKNREIPSSMDIELDSCYAASGNIPVPTNKTKDELKKLFIDKKIEDITGNKVDSFAYKFSKNLFNHIPQYNGKINAYYGYVSTYVQDDVLARDKVFTSELVKIRALGAGFKDKDENSIEFDKGELKVEFSRSDLSL